MLSAPFPLSFLFASRPAIMGQVLGIVYSVIATYLTRKAAHTKSTAQVLAVTLIHRRLKRDPRVRSLLAVEVFHYGVSLVRRLGRRAIIGFSWTCCLWSVLLR